jgi:hypothetical protein
METRDQAKKNEAVKMMREIRDKISIETQNMSLEQLKRYIEEKLKRSPLKTLGR